MTWSSLISDQSPNCLTFSLLLLFLRIYYVSLQVFSLLSSWALLQTVLSFPTSDCNCTSLISADTFWGFLRAWLKVTQLCCARAGPWVHGSYRGWESSAALPMLWCGDFGKDNQAYKTVLCSSGHTDGHCPNFLLTWGWQGSAHSCYPSFLLLWGAIWHAKLVFAEWNLSTSIFFKWLKVIPFLCNLCYSQFWGWVSSSLLSIRRHIESGFLLASSLIPFKTMSSDGLDLPRAII